MRLLFISNLYPPHHRGGYSMLCREVEMHLTARGHEVTVLTSTYGMDGKGNGQSLQEPNVYRWLMLESDVDYYRPHRALSYWANRHSNLQAVQQVVAETEPDAVVIWGMWNMSRLVAAWAERLAQSRVVYYLADTWPALPSAHEAYWDDAAADGPLGKALKRTLRLPVRLMLRKEWRPFSLRFEHVLVCSQSVRKELLQAGLDMHHAQVLYHGIDPAPYREAAKQRAPNSGSGALRVVYVGSLLSHKGVHTAIEAIGHLAQSGSPGLASLTVLGSGHPDYEAHLRQLVERWQVEDAVSFHSPIPRLELPAFLAQFDVLVLPSTYEEPLARITQEAMAAGLVLVGTLTGGTKEILVDGENGLAFAAEDAQGLAAQLRRLSENPELQLKLTQAAWQTVTERFTVSRLIDQLEAYLSQVAAGQRSIT